MLVGFIGERRGLEWNLFCGFFFIWKDFEYVLKWVWLIWFVCVILYVVWWIVVFVEGEMEKEEMEEDCVLFW